MLPILKVQDYFERFHQIRNENKQIIQRKIYINDVPYPLNNGYLYQSKNGQVIHQKMEDNNINSNIKNNRRQKFKIKL